MPFEDEDSSSSPRYNAIARVVVGIVLTVTTILPILWAVALVSGVAWMIVDVILQLIYGSEGWPNGMSFLSEWLSRLFYWPFDMTEWILFGTRDFPFTP